MNQLKINHAAVWVVVVFMTILGFLWYDMLFGEAWMSMVGLDMATVEANPPGAGVWITNFVATVVPIYTLAWMFTKMKVSSPLKGAAVGFLIAFSFVLLNQMSGNMFAQNPYALTWITGGFQLVGLSVAGLILGGWRKYSSTS